MMSTSNRIGKSIATRVAARALGWLAGGLALVTIGLGSTTSANAETMDWYSVEAFGKSINWGGAAGNAGKSAQSRTKRIRSDDVSVADAAAGGRKTRARGVRTASLGSSTSDARPQRRPSITGGSGRVTWVASSGCLASNLRSTINYVAANYGSVTVSSTCRSRAHNRRVGGASKSHHLTGNAADFRVSGNVSGAAAYLRSAVGGFKHYGGGLFHIDNGARRTWS